jgi:hypothetical protein
VPHVDSLSACAPQHQQHQQQHESSSPACQQKQDRAPADQQRQAPNDQGRREGLLQAVQQLLQQTQTQKSAQSLLSGRQDPPEDHGSPQLSRQPPAGAASLQGYTKQPSASHAAAGSATEVVASAQRSLADPLAGAAAAGAAGPEGLQDAEQLPAAPAALSLLAAPAWQMLIWG